MRKLFLHIGVSVDGYIEDDKKQFDWPVDREWEAYVIDLLRAIDGQIYGRIAHESLAAFWPHAAEQPGASKALAAMARLMNESPKYVVTRGPYRAAWSHSHVLTGDVAAEVRHLKNQPGKDLVLFAGANVAQSFMAMGLLDEFRLVLNPVVLGGGTPLFAPGVERRLQLVSTRPFASGVLVVTYAPAG
jgi:dihydrofolate reductase